MIKREVIEDGLVADLFYDVDQPRKAIIMLGGSEGGKTWSRIRQPVNLLVQRGYAIFSLEGGMVSYKDRSGNGLKALITEYDPGKSYKMTYKEVLGAEAAENPTTNDWLGCTDHYAFEHRNGNGNTRLIVESTAPEVDTEAFFDLWSKAMEKIKKIAETVYSMEKKGFCNVNVLSLPEKDSPVHTHDRYTVHAILNGELVISDSNGENKIYRENDWVEFPAGTTHRAASLTKYGNMVCAERI